MILTELTCTNILGWYTCNLKYWDKLMLNIYNYIDLKVSLLSCLIVQELSIDKSFCVTEKATYQISKYIIAL